MAYESYNNCMLVVSIVIGLGILGVMVYLALSKKSRFWIRVAALVALGLMIAAVIVSLIIILLGMVSVVKDSIIVDPDIPPAPPAEGNSVLILIFILFLIALFVTVLILSLREQRRKKT